MAQGTVVTARDLAGNQVVLVEKNLPANARRREWRGFSPWVGKIPLIKKWQPTPVFLPGESHGQRSLVGYSPLDHKELDMIEYLTIALNTKGKLIFNYIWDFPGGPMVTCQSACQSREHGFDSWSGKIPHAMGQLNPHTTTTEPAP